jgi:hypothetical protein
MLAILSRVRGCTGKERHPLRNPSRHPYERFEPLFRVYVRRPVQRQQRVPAFFHSEFLPRPSPHRLFLVLSEGVHWLVSFRTEAQVMQHVTQITIGALSSGTGTPE